MAGTTPTAAAAPKPNPLQPSYLPKTPLGQATTGQATTGRAATLSPQQINALGPQATIQQILAGFQPQARQATGALNNTLAAGGIVGGGAQGAQQDLQGQLRHRLRRRLHRRYKVRKGCSLARSRGIRRRSMR